jgi:NADPH:quinone reductase-like Zn-dependent oxidoreductase
MKAAVVTDAGKLPVYAEFAEPAAAAGEVVVEVTAAPLSQVTRARASGAHYSSSAVFPFVAGFDGVGRRGRERVYFLLPRAPFGSMAQRTVMPARSCVRLPDGIDDVTAAAIAIPGMSSWAALTTCARLVAGETVFVNGATGISGRLAVQIAKHLGARKIIATGRNRAVLDALAELGADAVISLTGDERALDAAFARCCRDNTIDVVLDYLWGASAERLLTAIAKSPHNGRPTRFVQIGSASAPDITLRYSVLRSYPLLMMGCGLGSLSVELMLQNIGEVLQAAVAHGFNVPTKTVPLAAVEAHWRNDSTAARTVFVTDAL